MIQCPECRMQIPDGSAFCDQCGKELKWCPECKRPKRGTECPVCGSDLIPGKKWLAGQGQPSPQPTSAGSVAPLHLVGNGWSLALQPGQFGRRGGIWPELSTCPYVSGNHGTLQNGAEGWTIVDNGSTNGTFINGVRLRTGSPSPLRKGDRVRIATLDFTAE